MPTKTEFIRFNTIKEYINQSKNMRASDAAIQMLIARFNDAVVSVITEAQALAKKDKRKTLMGTHMAQALEKYLGKRHLTWQETSEEIIRQNPADLGNISKTINEYIQKAQKQK